MRKRSHAFFLSYVNMKHLLFIAACSFALGVLAEGVELRQLRLNETVALQVSRDQPVSLTLELDDHTQVSTVCSAAKTSPKTSC